jgi:hypothetical protein
MKFLSKITLSLLTLLIIYSSSLYAQSQKNVCLKIGGSYYINCERTIVFGEQAIMSVNGDDERGRTINFDIFSSKGILDASLKDGNFSGTNVKSYAIAQMEEHFTITHTRSNRLVLMVKNVENKTEKRNEFHIWADFFLPDGNRFQCTPEASNVPMLEMIKGATFTNSNTAIQLN